MHKMGCWFGVVSMEYEYKVKRRFMIVDEFDDLKFRTGDVLKLDVCISEHSSRKKRLVIVEGITEMPLNREYIFSVKNLPGKGQIFCRQRSDEYIMEYRGHVDNYKPNYKRIHAFFEKYWGNTLE